MLPKTKDRLEEWLRMPLPREAGDPRFEIRRAPPVEIRADLRSRRRRLRRGSTPRALRLALSPEPRRDGPLLDRVREALRQDDRRRRSSSLADLTKVEGRKLVFDVSATDGVDVIAEGTHERFIVDAERFDPSVAKKRSG